MASTTTITMNPLSSSTSKMPALRARPYKDFLTPALHKRFTNAALFILVGCWVEATLMSEFHLLWSWFPLGFTGMRAGMLALSCLSVFIIRVANLHIGARTTTSPIETFYQAATSMKTALTVFWYVFSAMIFCEVYIWSRGASLAWVDYGRAYERPRLNENAVLFRTMFFLIGAIQSAIHLYRDYDRVDLAESKSEEHVQVPLTPKTFLTALVASRKNPQQHFIFTDFIEKIKVALPTMVNNAALLAAFVSGPGPALYFAIPRRHVHRLAYDIVQIFVERKLPKRGEPPGITAVPTLVFQACSSVFLLGMLWELSNLVFSKCVAEPPLKKEFPLTAASKDPNGSLLSGLKSRKEVPHSYAFWELAMICEKFDERRKTLYAEIERKEGSTWSQIKTACLAEIEAVSKRIEAQDPAAMVAASMDKQAKEERERAAIKPLPRIANQKVQNSKDVFNYPTYEPITRYTKPIARLGSNKLLSPEVQKRLRPDYLAKDGEGLIVRALKTPAGVPFRQVFARRVCAVIFGIPHSNAANIVRAAKSLTRLSVCSFHEDTLGQVQRDVAAIVRALTKAVTSTEKFVASLSPHWTDVGFQEENSRVPEVEEMVIMLKAGLEELLLVFGEYYEALDLTKKDIREAKEAVGKNEEMGQRKRDA